MKNLSLAAAVAACLALPAFAQSGPTVKNIEVLVDMSAVQNPQAAAYWAKLEPDLEAAILAKLTDRIADDGANLTVDVSELELASGFQEAAGIADTRLVAQVHETHDEDNSRFYDYDISVDVNSAIPLLPAGTDVTVLRADTPEFYAAMVAAMADAVVGNIK